MFYVDPSNSTAHGTNLVHIHADGADPVTTKNLNYTFYGRLDKFSAVDNRQALPASFAAHYNPDGATFPTGSALVVWRDIKVPQGYFACGVLPAWYPLGYDGIGAFDDQERITQPDNNVHPFPAATQVVTIGSATLPVFFSTGWLFLNLSGPVPGEGQGMGFEPNDTDAAQAWVQVLDKLGFTQFLTMHNAQQLDTATQANHFVP